MPRKKPRKASVHRAVAVEAARILSEQGHRDYCLAKKKAARRLGISPDAGLPKNREIEEALRESLDLFGGRGHRERLRTLRGAALQAMDFLAEFNPRLVGPVLEGTADEYSPIQLQVFAEAPEQFAMFLDQRSIPYDQLEHTVRLERNRQETFPLFQFNAGEYPYDVTVLSLKALRQPPLSPVDGRPMRRASIHAVRCLLDEEPAAAVD